MTGELINTVINAKYRILALIGTGGMANVYQAINLNNRRMVAIKMLKPEFTEDPEFLRRFEREARAAIQLSHDNIVRAFGVGQYKDLPYIVLEYVEGPTLKQLIMKNGALSTRSAIGITCQMLDAIATAHNHEIIHRDIKPQNIIMGNRGKVKLTDFGIAQDASASTRTFAGAEVVGSVHYISPEQAKGEEVVAASDIYSLGVTLYEMLTGEVPFSGDSSVTIALMHLQNDPIPPEAINSDVPRALSDIVMRAMGKDPQTRYPDCKSMRADLVRSLSDPGGDFVRNRQDGNSRSKKPRERTPAMYIWISALVAAPILLLLLWFVSFQSQCFGDDPVPAATLAPTASPSPTPGIAETPAPGYARIPSLIGHSFGDALRLLNETGFTNIFVTVQVEPEDPRTDQVIEQSHTAGSMLPAGDPIRLTVLRSSPGKYKADVSFSVDILENESELRIAYASSNVDDISYFLVAFETVRAAEENATITATVYSNDPVIRTLLLFVGDEEVRQQDVKFSE